MINIIDEKDRKHRTWKAICNDFPDSHVAIENPDEAGTGCTGGMVSAYSVPGDAKSASELGIYAHHNNALFTNTLAEGGIMFL